MSKALQLLLISAFVLHAWRAAAQPLTMEDYDRFYDTVIRNAGNETREAWLASYDPIVNFVARVRRDVEALPVERQRALARAVHDNGYWKGQEARVRDPRDPFLGAALSGDEARLKAVLTPEGHEAYRTRYAQGARGYRLTLAAVGDRAAFYRLHGKDVPGVSELPATTPILNANARAWDDLVIEARNYPQPEERLKVIVGNQLNAIASALALMRGTRTLTDDEMDRATAVIWRYTGHYSGRDGWEKEPLVRTPYDELPAAEKVKDRPVWQAVRSALNAGAAPQ